MFWILAGTFLGGLVTTRALLEIDVDTLWLRYAVAVIAAYGAFLILIRLWLWYIARTRMEDELAGDGSLEAIDILSELRGGVSFGGGGEFGGGGASGSWGEVVVEEGVPAVAQADAAPEPGGCGFDLDAGIVLVAFIALVLTLVIAGGYIIWAAPAILAEAAFEAALAAALARRALKIDRPSWVGTVWRATVWPFLSVLIFSIAAGAIAQGYCPEATRLREVMACLRAE